MADVTQEVKARLTVEQDGEPEVFGETASEIQGLADTVGSSAAQLSEVADLMARAAEQAQELGTVGQQAIKDFASAMKEASRTDDLDAQAEALKRAATAWRTFGDEAAKAGTLPEKALKDLETQIEQLERQAREMADPLVKGAREAAEALEKVEGSAKKGFSGAEKSVAAARRAIDDYKKSLEAAKAAGGNVTAGQEAELARLEARYKSVVGSIGQFRAEEAAAKKEIDSAEASVGKQITSVNSLGDLLEASGPKWAAFVQGAGLVVGAFSAGYAAGEKLRSILNELTDGGFDRATQGILRMRDAAEAFVGSADTMADKIRLLANQKNIFENLGLEGFSSDLAENQRILNEHQLGIKKSSDSLEEFARKLGLSREELDKQAAALAKNVTAFAAANPQLAQGDLAAILKKPIQEVLDSYAKLGIQVPAQLAGIASAWGIPTSAAEAAAAKAEAVANRILTAITGVTAKTSSELAAQAAGIELAFSKIHFPSLNLEELNRASLQIQKVVDDFSAAGVAIPKSLANIAAQYGVYQDQVGQAVSTVDKLAPSAARASAGLIDVKKSAEGAGSAAAALTERAGSSSDGLIKWSVSAQKASGSAKDLGTDTTEVTRSLDGQRFSIEDTSPSLDELMARYGATARQAQEMGKGATAGGAAVAAAGTQAAQGVGSVRAVAEAMADSAVSALEAASGAQAGASGFSSAGTAASGAKEPLSSAATALGAAGEKASESSPKVAQVGADMDKAAASTQGMSQAAQGVTFAPAVVELDGLRKAASLTAKAMEDELTNAFIVISTKVVGFSGPILAEFQKIIDKAAEAKAALESVEA